MPPLDPRFRDVWLMWAAAFLLTWIAVILTRATLRRSMVLTSAFTAPFGLTEPLFAPRYWDSPSLFDLAHRTGLVLALACTGAVCTNTSRGERERTRAHRLSLKHAPSRTARWEQIVNAATVRSRSGAASR